MAFLIIVLLVGCNNANDKAQNKITEKETELSDSIIDDNQKVIVFFGNSLTAGYGIDPGDAFPALIQKKLDSLGYNYKVVDAGLSGETTASGLNRIEWVLKQKPDVFVLELGGNDGLRGIPLVETRKNLNKMIEIVREQNESTKIILAGMMIPPNMGQKYTDEFRGIFPQIAEKKNVYLIPFLLDGVGGERELNLPDMIHPNEAGHKVVAENVWSVLGPIVRNSG